MQPNYIMPFKVEQLVAKRLFEMEQRGWLVNSEKLLQMQEDLTDNTEALIEHLTPMIPAKPKIHGKEVENPFKADGKPVKRIADWLGDHAQYVSGPLCKVQWIEINLRSDKQVKDYLLSIGWKPLEWNINKKTNEVTSPKLTVESYDSIPGDIGQQVAHFLILSHRLSLVNGWIKNIRPDGTIAQVINNMTPTFRCTHKGIVNVPGGDVAYGLALRSAFIAHEGYKIVGVDAKSCQLRMLCHYMRDYLYTEAVVNGKKEDGTDIHSVNMQKTGGLLTNRTQAKRFIYGLLFGAGDKKLGAILGGTKNDGTRLRDEFMMQLPTLKELLDTLEKVHDANGYLVGLDGRKFYPRAKNQRLVYLVQSAEAILMKWAIALLETWGFYEKFDAHLVCFMHDELQHEVREDQAELAAEWIKYAIYQAGVYLNLEVPAEGDSAIGNNWRETH